MCFEVGLKEMRRLPTHAFRRVSCYIITGNSPNVKNGGLQQQVRFLALVHGSMA